MLLCFIDESNTPPKATQYRMRPPFFALSGVFVPSAQWRDMARELEALKRRNAFRIRGEIKWRYFGAHNNDPKNTVAHLNKSDRDASRTNMFSILTRRNSVKIVVAVADVAKSYRLRYINDEHDLYGLAHKTLSERFQYHLQDLSRAIGSTETGLIIADHRGRKDDERLRRSHQKLLHAESPFISNYGNLVETLFLTPSHMSVGVQFADMVAGAVARAYNSSDERWLNQVRPAFRSRPDGSIDGYGLVKIPGNW